MQAGLACCPAGSTTPPPPPPPRRPGAGLSCGARVLLHGYLVPAGGQLTCLCTSASASLCRSMAKERAPRPSVHPCADGGGGGVHGAIPPAQCGRGCGWLAVWPGRPSGQPSGHRCRPSKRFRAFSTTLVWQSSQAGCAAPCLRGDRTTAKIPPGEGGVTTHKRPAPPGFPPAAAGASASTAGGRL